MPSPESFPRTPANRPSSPKTSSYQKRKPSIQHQQSSGWGWPRFVSVEVDVEEKRRQRKNEAMPVNATAELSRPEQSARNQSFQKAHGQLSHGQAQNGSPRRLSDESNRIAALVSEEHDKASHALPTPAAELQSNGKANDQISDIPPQTETHRKHSNGSNRTAALVSEAHDKAYHALPSPAAERQSNGNARAEGKTIENDTNARPGIQILAEASKIPLPPEKETSPIEDASAERQFNENARVKGKTIDHKNDTNARPDIQILAEARKIPLPPEKETSPIEDASAERRFNKDARAKGKTIDRKNDTNARPHIQEMAEASKTQLPPRNERPAVEDPSADTADKHELTSAEQAQSHRRAEHSSFYEESDGSTQDGQLGGSALDPLSKDTTTTPGAFPDDDGESVYSELSLNDKVAQEPASDTKDVRDDSPVDKEESFEQSQGNSQEHPVSKFATKPKARAFSPGPPESSISSGTEPSEERDAEPLDNEQGRSEPIQTISKTLPAGEVRKSVESLPKKSPRQSVAASSPSGTADTNKSLTSPKGLWVPPGNYASGETTKSLEDIAPRQTVKFSTQGHVESLPEKSPRQPIIASSPLGKADMDKSPTPPERLWEPLGNYASGETVESPEDIARRQTVNVSTQNPSAPKPSSSSERATEGAKANDPCVTEPTTVSQTDDRRASEIPGRQTQQSGYDNEEAIPDPLAASPTVTRFSKPGQEVDNEHSLPEIKDGNQETTSDPLAESPAVTGFSKAGEQVDNEHPLPEDKGVDEEAGKPNESQPPELKRSETQPVDIMKRISVPASINARDEDGDEQAGQPSESQPPELKRSETKPVDLMERISVPPSINARRGSKPAKKVTLPPPQIFVQSPSDATPLDDELAEPHPTPAGHLHNDEYRITSRNGSVVSIQHTVNSAAEKLGSSRLKKRKLYLRKARNLAARRVFLNAALGRKMGGRTKDRLQRLARGEEIPSTPVPIQPHAADSPPLKKRKSVIRKVRNVASRQSLLDAALGRQVGRETKPVLRRMAKGENVVVEEA